MSTRRPHGVPELAALLLTILLAGCGAGRQPVLTSRELAVQRLDRADALVRGGRYLDARDAYTAVLAEPGAPVEADRALLGLARLALAPENPTRDEREAARYLDRVLFEYPQSPSAAEARAWRELLRSLERLQRDVQRQQQDLQRLRRVLEHEQQEVARLQQERERLRQVDLELERPPKGLTPTSGQPVAIPRE